MTYGKSTKEKDLELWRAYKASPSAFTLKPLLKQLDPVIQSETNKWVGAIARPVLEAKAKALALEAIDSYDPNAGAALASHVTNRLLKLSRTVYSHQDAVRTPEHKKLKVMALHRAETELLAMNGREPTNAELQQHLKWSPKSLSEIQSATAPELVESGDVGGGLFETRSAWAPDNPEGVVNMVYYDMDPIDQLIFEHSTGYSGKPLLSNPELCAKTNLTLGQLSYRKTQIRQRLQNHL